MKMIMFVCCVLLIICPPLLADDRSEYQFCLLGKQEQSTYEVGLLKMALEVEGKVVGIKTQDHSHLSHARYDKSVNRGIIKCDIFLFAASHDVIKDHRMINFPITLGMLGYRAFIIREVEKSPLAEVKSLVDLKNIKIAQGKDWDDSQVLINNGFTVENEAGKFLLSMLAAGRVDVVHRGIIETSIEKNEYAKRKLMREKNVMLVYLHDLFFYVNADDVDLYKKLTTGFEKILANGVLEAYIRENEHMSEAIEILEKEQPQVFHIKNQIADDVLKTIPKCYWYVQNPLLAACNIALIQ